VKIEQSQYPIIVPNRVPQRKAVSPSSQKNRGLSTRLDRIHPSNTSKKIRSFGGDPLVVDVFSAAIGFDDSGGRFPSNPSSISSKQIDKLWFRQKTEICPLIDIFV